MSTLGRAFGYIEDNFKFLYAKEIMRRKLMDPNYEKKVVGNS